MRISDRSYVHVFCASANHLGALGHPAHAARPGRCCDGAAGLRSPTTQRSDLKSVYAMCTHLWQELCKMHLVLGQGSCNVTDSGSGPWRAIRCVHATCVLFEHDESLFPHLYCVCIYRRWNGIHLVQYSPGSFSSAHLEHVILQRSEVITQQHRRHTEQLEVCATCLVILLVHSEPIGTARGGRGVQRLGCVIQIGTRTEVRSDKEGLWLMTQRTPIRQIS